MTMLARLIVTDIDLNVIGNWLCGAFQEGVQASVSLNMLRY